MTDSVAATLSGAGRLGLARLDAQLLLAHVLQRPRTWLLAHDDAAIAAVQQQHFEALCRRRADGEPLAYLVGTREFHGLTLHVSPAVLVPRPETETLVDWALELLRGPLAGLPQPAVADLGTGSGAIALAVKAGQPSSRVCAVDASPAAIEVACANAAALGLELECLVGDWWQPLAKRRFDLVLSNPPYVAAGDPHLDALRYEPALALSPGENPLASIERIVAQAPAHLRPGAWLLLEHGHHQAGGVRQRLHEAGFVDLATRTDLAGLARCSGGRRRPD